MKKFTQWLSIYNEVNWEADYPDVTPTCEDPEKIVAYLNAVRANKDLKTADREKFSAAMPFVHAKSSFFGGGDQIDAEEFAKRITEPPVTIVNTNEKIINSGRNNEFVYKTGIPAFRGIVYDEHNKKFVFVNTCPGAGSCVAICYARKNRYIQYPVAYDSMTRRLNFLMNHPEKYKKQLKKELKEKCIEHNALKGYKPKVILRWNDSGDFFARKYMEIAEQVMKELKDDGFNIDSYAYTKIADVANKADFQTTFSVGANKNQDKLVDLGLKKKSIVVPKEMFKDLELLKIADEEKLRSRIAAKFDLPIEDILTYDELMHTPNGDKPKWHVIVTPDSGDDAAFRKDVKTILLTEH